MDLAKVWPLEFGVVGIRPTDNATEELVPGTPGFMELEDAVKAEKEGRVQLMAGKGWGELKTPPTERPKPKAAPKAEPKPKPAPAPEKATSEYTTAEMKPAESTKDEADEGTYKTREMKPKRRPGRPPKNQG